MFEARRGALGARLGAIGDLTYSSYLLHFPLMVLVALGLRTAGRSFDLMLTIPGLLGYFAVLAPLSLVCHRRFERPLQRWLRNRLNSEARSGADLHAPRPAPSPAHADVAHVDSTVSGFPSHSSL